jgi:hypothetical protein
VEILEARTLLSSGLPKPAVTVQPSVSTLHVVEASGNQNALKGTSTAFHLGSFTDSSPTGGPWAVDIIWGDGSPDTKFVRTSTGSLGDTNHTYSAAITAPAIGPNGFDPTVNYWAKVSVTNAHGDVAVGQFAVAITNVPHVIESTIAQPTLKGQAMTFQLGSFTDTGASNGPWTVDVNWGDGSAHSTFTRSAPGSLGSLVHNYTGANPSGLGSLATPVATVRVTNAHGDLGIGTFPVAIVNIPQVIEPLQPQNALKGVATSFALGSLNDAAQLDGPWTVDVNWGDGSAHSTFPRNTIGTLGNLSHTYTIAHPTGTGSVGLLQATNFQVTVRVTNGRGDIATGTFGVILTNTPHVTIPLPSQNAAQGKPTAIHLGSFTDSVSSDGPWSVDVNWGDGSAHTIFTANAAGSLGDLSHTYPAPGPVGSNGVYHMTVTVTNRHGDAGAGAITVTITNIPRITEPLSVQPALKGVATTFQLGSFTDADPTDQPWTVTINWGDGSPVTKFTRSTAGSLGTLVHTYTGSGTGAGSAGNYWVSIAVTNVHGDFGTAGFSVNITNVPHVVEPVQSQNVLKGQATSIALGSFTDSNPGDGPWTVDVNWGDGSADSKFTWTSVGSLGSVSHTYGTVNPAFPLGPDGSYPVTVTVTNSHGNAGIGHFQAIITNIPHLTEPVAPQDGLLGKSASYNLGSFTDTGVGDGPWKVVVNWGDGSATSTFTKSTTGALGLLAHVFTAPQGGVSTPTIFSVTVRVTNQHGDTGVGSFFVNLTNVPHVSAPATTQSALKGQATTLWLGSFTDSDPTDGPWKVVVNWGDGSPTSTFTKSTTGSLGTLAHTYLTTGHGVPGLPDFMVTVTVTNQHGSNGVASFGVNLSNVPHVTEALALQNAQAGKATTFQLGSFTDSGTGDGPWTVDVNWGDGSVDTKFTRTAPGSLGSLTHTYPDSGSINSALPGAGGAYTVKVKVTNQHGDAGVGSFGVNITNVPRVSETPFPPQPAVRGQVTTFSLGSFTDSDPTNGPWTVVVNWGDGSSPSTFTRSAPGTLGTLTHTYADVKLPNLVPVGTYNVTVTVTNRHGDFGVGKFAVQITNVPLVKTPTQPQAAQVGKATSFQLGSVTDPLLADGPWSVDVNWGDGSPDGVFTRTATGTLGSLAHTYSVSRPSYLVKVSVTNRHGDVGINSFMVTLGTSSSASPVVSTAASRSSSLGVLAPTTADEYLAGSWVGD